MSASNLFDRAGDLALASSTFRRLRRTALRFAALACVVPAALAQSLAPVGCPVFHCTVEATGVMSQPLVQTAPVVTNNNTLGTLRAQGCSGNGAQLACLFGSDSATGTAKGTLKLIDATTLQPLWGSAGIAGSQDLDARSSSGGQVPVVFANGQLAAGDNSMHVLYAANGQMISKVSLTGSGSNFGLTPISDTFGVVSQNDGTLTLINMTTWQTVGQPLVLQDQNTKVRVTLVSPSSASAGVLYAVAANPKATSATNAGYLFSVVLNPTNTGLRVRNQYQFDGVTGASPVVVSKTISGLAANLVLLHAPGLNGDNTDRLLGLKDNPLMGGFQVAWGIVLGQPLQVSPSIDANTQTLYMGFKADPHIYQFNFMTGARGATYDLRAMGGFPADFAVNGHLGATQTGSVYTLLLSGTTAQGQSPGQYMLALAPIASPNTLVWTRRTSAMADQFTAAWNLGPSSQPGIYCPVVVGGNNGLTRVCDY